MSSVVERLRAEVERMSKAGLLPVYEIADDRGLTIDEYVDLIAPFIASQAAEIERLTKERDEFLTQLSANLGGVSRYKNEQGDYRDNDEWSAFLLERTEILRLESHDYRRRAETAERLLAGAKGALEFYADETRDGYDLTVSLGDDSPTWLGCILEDAGDRARTTLSNIGGHNGE